jgi:hypothetical protein
MTKRILQEHIDKEADPAARLRAAILTHLYLSEAMQPWFYFSYMEAKNLSKEEQALAVASELYTRSKYLRISSFRGRQWIFFAPRPSVDGQRHQSHGAGLVSKAQ